MRRLSNRLLVSFGSLVLMTQGVACTTPRQHGQSVDPATYVRAERQCRKQALARYGAPPPGERGNPDEECDPRSWLCQKSKAWMLRESNALSSATARDRLVYESTRRCLAERGYSLP